MPALRLRPLIRHNCPPGLLRPATPAPPPFYFFALVMPSLAVPPTSARRRGRPTMRWMDVEEAAAALDWDAGALERVLRTTKGRVLPGAIQDKDGAWNVPESAIRRITGAGLMLFSIPTLAELLDCQADTLREHVRSGKIAVVNVPGVGRRVRWAEYQRLIGGAR
jgi:hypothetical protein